SDVPVSVCGRSRGFVSFFPCPAGRGRYAYPCRAARVGRPQGLTRRSVMRIVGLIAGVLVLGLVATVRAEEKADVTKEKVVGTWEVIKSEEGGPPKGGTIEFAKDGKVKMTHKQDGKEETAAGTFTLTGNKLTVTMKH